MAAFLSRVLVAVWLCACATAVRAAEPWPQRPIKIMVPFAPGGGVDFVARVIAKHLQQRLERGVYVENRAGANGAIALQALMQAEPDGHTLALTSDSPLTVNPTLRPYLPYRPLRDFAPIAMVAKYPILLTAHPSIEARSLHGLITLAKQRPGTLLYASAGVGNFNHLTMELLSMSTGAKFVHVPYKGTAPASLGVLAGEVQLMFNNVQLTLEHVRAGKLIALAVGEAQRLPELPDVPAVAETVADFDMAPWAGLIAPAATPSEIVMRLSRETLAIVQLPEVAKLLADQHVVPAAQGPDQFAALIERDTARWAGVIKSIGIKIN